MNLAIVVPHFNVCNYHRPAENLARFVKGTPGGVDCLAFAKFGNELTIADYIGGLTVRATGANALWQKERLINLAIGALPPEFDAVAWIDGDLLFDNPDWYALTCQMLSDFPVVQMFETIRYLGPNDEPIKAGYAAAEGERLGFRVPGGAIACRRELLENGIYDRDIIGGGDDIFMSACLGTHRQFWSKRHQPMQNHVRQWCESFGTHSVGVVPGNVRHLWHGSLSNRGYMSKHEILAAHDFDPSTDVRVGDTGLLEWASDKPALHAAVLAYFADRNEDAVVQSV